MNLRLCQHYEPPPKVPLTALVHIGTREDLEDEAERWDGWVYYIDTPTGKYTPVEYRPGLVREYIEHLIQHEECRKRTSYTMEVLTALQHRYEEEKRRYEEARRSFLRFKRSR